MNAKQDCADDLAEANGFLKQILALRVNAKKGKFFLIPSPAPGRFYPSISTPTRTCSSSSSSPANVTRAELKQQIKFLSRYRAATIKALNEMVKDAVKERNEIAEKCAEKASEAEPAGDDARRRRVPGRHRDDRDAHDRRNDRDDGSQVEQANAGGCDDQGEAPTALSGSVASTEPCRRDWSPWSSNGSATGSTRHGLFVPRGRFFPTFDGNTRPGATSLDGRAAALHPVGAGEHHDQLGPVMDETRP